VKALAAHINSLTCPRAKFHSNQCGGGITRVEIGKDRVTNRVRFKNKIATKDVFKNFD
jgi:hypothetical protein